MLNCVSFAQGLADATMDDLVSIAQPGAFQAGELIQAEGEVARALFVVAEGRVRIYRASLKGREQVLHIVGPGGHFNHVPVFDGGPCAANADAVSDGLVIGLPTAELRRLVGRRPDLALAFLTEFAGRLRHLVELVDELSLHTVQSRLAALLLTSAEASARGQSAGGLTQQEMAAQLGTVREMVGRTLKSFKDQGLVAVDHGTVTILDRRGLQALVED